MREVLDRLQQRVDVRERRFDTANLIGIEAHVGSGRCTRTGGDIFSVQDDEKLSWWRDVEILLQ